LVWFFEVLGIEPGVLGMMGKYSLIELYPHFYFLVSSLEFSLEEKQELFEELTMITGKGWLLL
jgi:hypothetical protein